MKKFMLVIALLSPLAVIAQTRESGPWWPSEWGPGDQAGASNRITPEKLLQALTLVESGEMHELGHVYSIDMPLLGTRSFSLKLLSAGSSSGSNGNVGNDEFVTGEIGQIGTQFDGLGHIGHEITMADGTVERVFYNGHTGREIFNNNGLLQLGIEHIKPILTHGILLDIAGYKGVERLAPDYEITVADAHGALARQGIPESAITEGDAVLFRTGYGPLWYTNEAAYNSDAPGIGLEVARWLINKKITLVGGDTYATEISRNPDPTLFGPVHQELMTHNGVFNIENMIFEELVEEGIYEFLFIVTPIRLKGATGSPLRPLAIH
jgi:kynurenine formamidase